MILGHFLNYAHVNATSPLERAGDYLLTPLRYLCNGKKFVLLEGEGESLCYKQPPVELSSCLNTLRKIIAFPGLILAPLGALLKGISLLSERTWQVYAKWKSECSSLTKELYETCKTKNLLKELYFEVCNHPKRYVLDGRLGFADFYECPCEASGLFNRSLTTRRAQFERAIVADFGKKEELDILSLGSGGLLQDWIVIGQLLQRGVSAINLVCVEPNPEAGDICEFAQFFKDANIDGITITRHMWMEYVTDQTFDIVLAIDFDKISQFCLPRPPNEEEARRFVTASRATLRDLAEGKSFEAARVHFSKHSLRPPRSRAEFQKYNKKCESLAPKPPGSTRYYGYDAFTAALTTLNAGGKAYLGHDLEDMVISHDLQFTFLSPPGMQSTILADIRPVEGDITILASQFIGTWSLLFPLVVKLKRSETTLYIHLLKQEVKILNQVASLRESLKRLGVSAVTEVTSLDASTCDYVVTGIHEQAFAQVSHFLKEEGSSIVLSDSGVQISRYRS